MPIMTQPLHRQHATHSHHVDHVPLATPSSRGPTKLSKQGNEVCEPCGKGSKMWVTCLCNCHSVVLCAKEINNFNI